MKKEFTVSIHGTGRLLGLVVVDGMKAFPKSTWYDYSDAMKRGVALEKQIADSGRMRPGDIPYVRRAVANQKKPRATDIALKFSFLQTTDTVTVIAGKKKRMFVFDERNSTLRDHFYDASIQVVRAIGQIVSLQPVQA